MEALILSPSQSTPSIRFNTDGFFEISGNSLPEDVIAFYKPVFDWLSQFAEKPTCDNIKMIFKLTYFNSASSKIILELLNLMEQISKHNIAIEVHWLYMEIDEDMLESGREYSEMVNLPFVFEKYV